MLKQVVTSRIIRGATAAAIIFLGGVTMLMAQKKSPAKHFGSTIAATPEGARAFTEAAEKKLLDLWIKGGRAQWVQENFITDDTEQIAADADQATKAATAELAAQARAFDKLRLPEDVARKLKLIKLSVDVPSPRDPAEQKELAEINASLQSDYGRGKWCPDGPQAKCLELPDLEK